MSTVDSRRRLCGMVMTDINTRCAGCWHDYGDHFVTFGGESGCVHRGCGDTYICFCDGFHLTEPEVIPTWPDSVLLDATTDELTVQYIRARMGDR